MACYNPYITWLVFHHHNPPYIEVGCGFKYLLFSPLFGEDEPILTCAYLSKGLVNQPPTR